MMMTTTMMKKKKKKKCIFIYSLYVPFIYETCYYCSYSEEDSSLSMLSELRGCIPLFASRESLALGHT